MFNIISLEYFDSIYGKIKKGDILETVNSNDKKEVMAYAFDKYGPFGENIKVKIEKC